MNLAGLAPDKAPPVEAPLVLFYLMPLFLGLAGLVLAWHGGQVLVSRWSPAALAATHFVVLGALAPVMCGALLQISPVLLGAPYPRVTAIARLTAGTLGAGSLLVGSGFLSMRPGLLLSGGVTVAAGLAVFVAASFRALAVAGRRETLWAVRLALLALVVTIALGLTLALTRFGWLELAQYLDKVHTHVAWGLAGWIGLLLAGLGMEIIPFFYISPGFNLQLRRALPFAVFGQLSLITVLGWLPETPTWALRGLIVVVFLSHLLYNAIALLVEWRRQRPRRDANLWLWQASHVAVFAAFIAWLGDISPSLIGILLLGGALSFVLGSLMKIVPFLTWLDLQQRRAAGRNPSVTLPRLHALLPAVSANTIALTLGTAIVAALAGAFAPPLMHLGGGLLVVCAILLAHALWRAARLRREVIRQIDSPGTFSGPR